MGYADVIKKLDSIYFPSKYYMDGKFAAGATLDEDIKQIAIFGLSVGGDKPLSYEEAEKLYQEALEEEKKKKNPEPLAAALYMAYVYCQMHIGEDLVNDGSLLYYYCADLLQRTTKALESPRFSDIAARFLPENSKDYAIIVNFHTEMQKEITVLKEQLTDICQEHIKSGDTSKPVEHKEVMDKYADLLSDEFIEQKIEKKVKNMKKPRKATKLEKMSPQQRNLYKTIVKKEYIEKKHDGYNNAKKMDWNEFSKEVQKNPEFKEISKYPAIGTLHESLCEKVQGFITSIASNRNYNDLQVKLLNLLYADTALKTDNLFLDAKNYKDIAEAYHAIRDELAKIERPAEEVIYGKNPPKDAQFYMDLISLEKSLSLFDPTLEASIKEEENDFEIDSRFSMFGGDLVDPEESLELVEQINQKIDSKITDYQKKVGYFYDSMVVGRMNKDKCKKEIRDKLADIIAHVEVRESISEHPESMDEYTIKALSTEESIQDHKKKILADKSFDKMIANLTPEEYLELGKPDGKFTPQMLSDKLKEEKGGIAKQVLDEKKQEVAEAKMKKDQAPPEIDAPQIEPPMTHKPIIENPQLFKM